jgi:hypothetical protein
MTQTVQAKNCDVRNEGGSSTRKLVLRPDRMCQFDVVRSKILHFVQNDTLLCHCEERRDAAVSEYTERLLHPCRVRNDAKSFA